MKRIVFFSMLLLSMVSCQVATTGTEVKVSNAEELATAIENAKAGDQIVMADGVWSNVEIMFSGEGTEATPIVLKAETPGKVFIEGKSFLKFGGSYLTVEGLYFRNGYTTSNAVIDFKFTKTQVATHCRVTNCVIEGFNQPKRDRKDLWVEFWGRYNQLDHCYIAGKANVGPTVRVEIKGNRNIRNYHKIINNHFGPRPRKGGPKGETIQLGDSFSSMSPSNTTVANNLFERCNGEVEIISSKTNFNEFRNNVFYMSEGSVVTRHGNYCTIDGNYFIGDGVSENVGGIRLINTGHKVMNNYFYNLKGENFRSPLAIMNGIPKSPLNRYNQVTDVVVAYNTWVNCSSPWQVGVGTNISQREVLPLSEIRSARPLRTEIANNIIYNEVGDPSPIVEHDKADGIKFESNIINNQGVAFSELNGLEASDIQFAKIGQYVMAPKATPTVKPYAGFEFETIANDILGKARKNNPSVGAMSDVNMVDPAILDKTKYGASWFSNVVEPKEAKVWTVSTKDDFAIKLAEASAGDILSLEPGRYTFKKSLIINKAITIQSSSDAKSTLVYAGEANTPAFSMNPKGDLTLKNIVLSGKGTQQAFASLKENMSSHYMLQVDGCDIDNFDYVLKAYKETFAEEITFTGTTISNCENGLELSEETNDKGDYNVEFLTIDHCTFDNVKQNVIDYYRGGYDESTIGGNLIVKNSKFTRCGAKEANGRLFNHRGIVNVRIDDNTFTNNAVKYVTVLWGAKNNTHANNTISKSGEILVQENLKLTIVY